MYTKLFLLFILIASCTTGRRAEPQELPDAALNSAVEAALSDSRFQSTDSFPEDWWTIFGDEQLAQLIEMAFQQNPTLQTAYAKLLQAAYQADQTRSSLFPNLLWGGDVSRQKFSETGIIPFKLMQTPVKTAPLAGTGGQAGIPVYFTQYETEMILTYDFDLWGKNRSQWLAALGDARAAAADQAFARLQLGISVAEVYFQLQTLYQRQEIAQTLVDNQAKLQTLTEKRVGGNVDNNQAFYTARISVASEKERLLEIQGEIAVAENQLHAYLAGNFEEAIQIVRQPLPTVPMPQNLPLHLLAHRPDIRAQLWLIQSAGKQIDAAIAGFYPDFNLAALFGYQTIHLKRLFEFPSTNFNVNPAFTLPIFDGYRLLANLRGSEINYDLAILRYNDMLLTAAREVLDGIAILRNRELQLKEYEIELTGQDEQLKLTSLRVQHHLNSNLDLLVSKQNRLTALDHKVAAYGETLTAILQLIKALGGGYDCS